MTEREKIIKQNFRLSEFEEDNAINEVGSSSKVLRTFRIFKANISDISNSRLDIFAVWNDTDKCPSIKSLKTFQNGKFVDTNNKVWDNFGIIPKCLKCNLYRKEKCRGYYYNYFCVLHNYNRFEGKEQKLPPKICITNKELLNWLLSGKGVILKDGIVSNIYSYDISKDNDFVSQDIRIKKAGSDEWLEPLLIYI